MELLEHPRFIDQDKCIACGLCAEKCPKKITDTYNAGLVKRKAAYVEYAQAVPLKYAIDHDCFRTTDLAIFPKNCDIISRNGKLLTFVANRFIRKPRAK